ncbi:MAG TPA: glycosyltransferase [Mycobacteriales bacterium]|nr:glycosyltransferase [Mycobacteriales bacterium]
MASQHWSPPDPERADVCVVGSGTHYISGISYYTYFLTRALSQRMSASAVLMRALIPRRFYPGRDRVGADITAYRLSEVVPTIDGVNWWGLPSIVRAARFVRRQRPRVMVLQWWTGAVLPWYLILARVARHGGGRTVIEFHEDLDTGEGALPLVRPVVHRGLRHLIRHASGFVVHSEWDRTRLSAALGLDADRVAVVPHGPYELAGASSQASATNGATTILFFGTIRPYKGVEHLVEAFDRLPRGDGQRWRLLIVGETWQGWTLPLELAVKSRFASDIEIVNRYVADAEVPGYFARADLVALPYLRSSASGPLHITMSAGLPVVVTEVGGLPEATRGYGGAVVVRPADPASLAAGLVVARDAAPRQLDAPLSWDDVADQYAAFLHEVLGFEGARSAQRSAESSSMADEILTERQVEVVGL